MWNDFFSKENLSKKINYKFNKINGYKIYDLMTDLKTTNEVWNEAANEYFKIIEVNQEFSTEYEFLFFSYFLNQFERFNETSQKSLEANLNTFSKIVITNGQIVGCEKSERFLTQFREKCEWVKWILTEASVKQFAAVVLGESRSVTPFQVKKFFLKMRSLSFNFPWVFNCFSMLGFPLIDGKNAYFFDSNLTRLSKFSQFEEGMFYFCELNKMIRFFKLFFGFCSLEVEIFERILSESGYFENLEGRMKEETCMVRYDQLFSLIRYSVLSQEGKLFEWFF